VPRFNIRGIFFFTGDPFKGPGIDNEVPGIENIPDIFEIRTGRDQDGNAFGTASSHVGRKYEPVKSVSNQQGDNDQ
jgi:hypothetical protein